MKRKGIIFVILLVLMCCITTTATTAAVILFIRSREAEAALNKQNDISKNTTTDQDSNTNPDNSDSKTNLDYKLQTQTISEETEAYSINIQYPELVNYLDDSTQFEFNDLVFYKVNSLAREIRFSEPSIMAAKNFIELDYTVEYQSARFLSILIKGEVYLGGAHPNPVIFVVNYDLESNKELLLKDLFISGSNYLTPISNTCIFELQTLLGEDFVEAGASADDDNFKNFNFTDSKLKITFDAYQVGPYALGTPEVEMPLVDFNAMLKAEFK